MLSDCHRKLHNQVCMKDTLQMKYRKKYWVVVIFFLFICLSGCGGHKQQSASIDLSTLHKVKATDFDELSDELSFDFVDKNGNEAKYVEIMDIDVDDLLEQIDNGTLEVSDPCAYWLVEGWLIAYFARVNGTDEDALISWLENDSHTVTRNSFQAFWVVVK